MYPWWLPWLAIPALIGAVVWFIVLLKLDSASRRYTIRRRTGGDEWGAFFDIVDPKGNVIGFDRYIPARQRCAALNSGRKE